MQQLDVLFEEGVDPRRVIVGHTDTVPDPEYHEELARRGAWIEFDTIRGKVPRMVERRVGYVLEARRRGLLGQLLLSQDTCALSHLVAYGNTGYGYLATGFLDELRRAGLDEGEIQALVIDNPRRALAGE